MKKDDRSEPTNKEIKKNKPTNARITVRITIVVEIIL